MGGRRDAMTPLERWRATLGGEKPDRLPMDYWATAEADRKLVAHTGRSGREFYEYLRVDRVITVSGRYTGPPVAEDADVFGCRYRMMDYGTGAYRECVHHPLADFATVEAIEDGYTWPSADWYDYGDVAAQVAGWEDYPIRGGGSEPYLIYKKLRGEEQAFVDLIENPEIVHHCLDRLFDLAYENTVRIYEALPGRVLLSYVAEDMGSQHGLMMSLDHIRTFLIPRMKRMVDLAHEAGVYVFHHNDGAIRDVLPDLIAMGIDILNPLQWRCAGMERAALKRDFGDAVVFHGGMDNQQTLAFGTVADVIEEVKTNIDVLGSGGGYILAPCHNIQAVSPPENIVAMYRAGFEFGRQA